MKKSKKTLAMLLVCLLLFTVTACGGSGGGGTEMSSGGGVSSTASNSAGSGVSGGTSTDSGGSGGEASTTAGSGGTAVVSDRTLNVAVALDSGTLHPHQVTGSGGFPGVLSTFMQSLFIHEPDGTRTMVLASEFTPVSNIQYVLKLKEGVTFSNGNKFNADDVMFTMKLCAETPSLQNGVRTIDMEKTKAIDEYTIDFWYLETANVAQEYGFATVSMLDAESFDDTDWVRNPVGTGPYVVTDYVVNSHVIVELRDDYWDTPPAIKRIHFKTINEDAQRINALEIGEVDIASIPFKDIEFINSLGDYTVRTISSGTVYCGYLSMDPNGLFNTNTAREAFCHAVDRQSIVDVIFGGNSSVPDWPLSENCIDYEPRFGNLSEIYSIGYDLDKAKQLAEEAGLIGKTIRVITNGDSNIILMAQIIQNDLMSIGVNVDIINYDQATYFTLLADVSNFEVALYFIAAPSLMACSMYYQYPIMFPLGWEEGPERDAYFELAAKATSIQVTDPTERSNNMYDLTTSFLNFNPWYSICEMYSFQAVNNDIGGANYSLSGGIRYSDLYFTS